MAFRTDAIAPPSSYAIADELAVDQSNWRDGLVLTRLPDPAVAARRWELEWEVAPKGFELSAAAHYRDNAANKDFDWKPPYALPPGQTVERVAYRGALEVRAENNAVTSAMATLERAVARD